MQRSQVLGFLFLAVGLSVFWPGLARTEVIKETFQGRILNANLEVAPDKELGDSTILIVPSADGIYRMELIQTLQALLKEYGINSLAFTASLMINDRQEMYYCDVPIRHTANDNLAEIDFWLNWLRGRGARSIPILGHSQGTITLTLLVERGLARDVPGVILLAPATQAFGKASQSRYETRYKVRLSGVLARSDEMNALGKGDEPMPETDYALCLAALVTPSAFVDRYRRVLSKNFPAIWRASDKPILIIGGTADTLSPDIEEQAVRATENPNVSLHVVEDAGHFFRDLFADEVVEVISEFVSTLK